MTLKRPGKILRRADPSTIQDKFLVGYQGWFTCAGDGVPVGPGHHGWLHWFNYPMPDGGRPNTDIWPDVSEYSPSELFAAPGLHTKSGDQCFLFSSRHPKSVQRHFHWMAQHGVDGAFLQRFAGQCDLEKPGNEGIFRIRDEVGDRVREAAEKEGRVFAIMYDVSGVAPDRIQGVIERDWIHLIRQKGILDSPNYLRERGKPVVALWGFGFAGNNHSPSVVRDITLYLRNMTPGGVYIMAGVPAHWRTSVQDADPNPDFVDVWLKSFDAISPWTIGRYSDEDEADRFANEKMQGDAELIKQANDAPGSARRVDYIPVVFPGGSGYNLSEGAWGFNNIKRNGGRFLWKQIFNARRHGARVIYGAMWDEYDEGTAFMPVVAYKSQLPVTDHFDFLALDADGYDLPSDWYMRICGFAVEGLRGERMIHETFPQKELQDYWSTRPRYDEKSNFQEEDCATGSSTQRASGSGSSGTNLVVHNPDEPPPPPYMLEDDTTEPQSLSQSSDSSAPARTLSISTAGPSPNRTSTLESTYTVSDLTQDMDQQSLTPSPFAQPPPLPLRSTTPLYPQPSTYSFRPPPQHESSLPVGPISLPVPSIPSFPVPPDSANPSGSYSPVSDPYAAWSYPPGHFQPGYYGPSHPSAPPPPLPLRPRPTSPPALSPPGESNSSHDPYAERRRVQSSAASYSPPSQSLYTRPPEPPHNPFFPQAFDAGGYPGVNYAQGSGFTPYQQYPPYGQYSPPPGPPPGHILPSSSYFPTNSQGYSPPMQQSTYPYAPPPPPPPRPSSANPIYDPGLSHSTSSGSRKAGGSAISLAKGGVDMLVGKRTRKSVQASVSNALKPFVKK